MPPPISWRARCSTRCRSRSGSRSSSIESPRRRQHHRHGGGGARRARRLHHPRQFLDPHRLAGDALEAAVQRPHRSLRRDPARQHACGDGGQSEEGLQDACRFRELRAQESGRDQLCLRRRRQFVSSQRRALPHRREVRGRARAAARRARGADRGDRRPARFLFRAAAQLDHPSCARARCRRWR